MKTLANNKYSFSLIFAHLGCKLCRERLCHSHSGRGGLELLLIDNAVHFAGLVVGTCGSSPWKEAVTGQYSTSKGNAVKF